MIVSKHLTKAQEHCAAIELTAWELLAPVAAAHTPAFTPLHEKSVQSALKVRSAYFSLKLPVIQLFLLNVGKTEYLGWLAAVPSTEAGCQTCCCPRFESTILLRFVSQTPVFNDKQELFSKESDIATTQK